MSICPICGKEFDPKANSKKPRKYCSPECYREGNRITMHDRYHRIQAENHRVWAKAEAQKLVKQPSLGLDELADYIYTNYNPRKSNRK